MRLNAHPQVACFNETHYLPLLLERFGADPAPTGTIFDMIDSLRFHTGERILQSNFAQIPITTEAWSDWRFALSAAHREMTVAAFQQAFEAFVCEQSGAKVVVDKTPCYGAYLPLLERHLGPTPTINLIRDAQPSVVSMLRHPGFLCKIRRGVRTWTEILGYHTITDSDVMHGVQIGEVRKMARLWIWRTMTPIHDAKTLDSPFLTLRFEDLLADPETFFRTLARFLDIDEDETWIADCAKAVNHDRGAPTRITELAGKSGKRKLSKRIKDVLRGRHRETTDKVPHYPEVAEARRALGYIK